MADPIKKSEFVAALTAIFEDTTEGNTAAAKANAIATLIDDYIESMIVNCVIPTDSVIISVSGGSGAPAVGVLNSAPISLLGDPASVDVDEAGGLTPQPEV